MTSVQNFKFSEATSEQNFKLNGMTSVQNFKDTRENVIFNESKILHK